MNDQQACRERGTDLFEIKESLDRIGKRYSESLNRLNSIGNRLKDDSGAINMSQEKRVSPDLPTPGAISDFQRIVDGYSSLADGFESTISKLEKII